MELGGNLSTPDENGSADLHRFFDCRTARHAGVLGVIWPNENLFLCSCRVFVLWVSTCS